MNEGLPQIRINLSDGGEFISTPDNTSLFRFAGKLAVYNHVFMLTDEVNSRGMYVFAAHPLYDQLEQTLVDNQYPLHDNMLEVPECDESAWNQMVHQEAEHDGDYIPDDWV